MKKYLIRKASNPVTRKFVLSNPATEFIVDLQKNIRELLEILQICKWQKR
jgi:hypothetical protein